MYFGATQVAYDELLCYLILLNDELSPVYTFTIFSTIHHDFSWSENWDGSG